VGFAFSRATAKAGPDREAWRRARAVSYAATRSFLSASDRKQCAEVRENHFRTRNTITLQKPSDCTACAAVCDSRGGGCSGSHEAIFPIQGLALVRPCTDGLMETGRTFPLREEERS